MTTLKELNAGLQQKINAHVFTIVVQPESEDPTDKLTRVMTELKMLEDELRKIQKSLDDIKQKLRHKERQFNITRENATPPQKLLINLL